MFLRTMVANWDDGSPRFGSTGSSAARRAGACGVVRLGTELRTGVGEAGRPGSAPRIGELSDEFPQPALAVLGREDPVGGRSQREPIRLRLAHRKRDVEDHVIAIGGDPPAVCGAPVLRLRGTDNRSDQVGYSRESVLTESTTL